MENRPEKTCSTDPTYSIIETSEILKVTVVLTSTVWKLLYENTYICLIKVILSHSAQSHHHDNYSRVLDFRTCIW